MGNGSSGRLRIERRIQRLVVVAWLLGGIGPAVSGAAEWTELARLGRSSIRSVDTEKHVLVLADDSLEGREAGARGGRAAGGYLIDQFAALELEAGTTDAGFVQRFGAGYRNIVGRIRGSDPQVAGEILLVSAHYDHVGYGSRGNSFGPFGYVHNGADDNASGVAALLELVEAIRHSGYTPRRTLYFAFWDAEEKGLLGSRHWLQHCPVPRDQIRLMINLDMVGRLRDQRLEVYGTRSWAGSRELVSRSNDASALEIDFRWETKSNSDHHVFFQRKIPYLMFHTGLHDNYHRPSDDAERLNYAGIEQVTELVWQTLLRVDQASDVGEYRGGARLDAEPARRRFLAAAAARPSRLGLRWDPTPVAEPRPGLRIERVTVGSPAAAAGIRSGDLIVRASGVPVTSSATFHALVFDATETMEIELATPTGSSDSEAVRTVSVMLRGEPLKLGVTWRENNAEPAVATVIDVAAGSPVDRAGIRSGDRILELGGERFQDGGQLGELAASIDLPTTILYERRGRIRTAELARFTPPE